MIILHTAANTYCTAVASLLRSLSLTEYVCALVLLPISLLELKKVIKQTEHLALHRTRPSFLGSDSAC